MPGINNQTGNTDELLTGKNGSPQKGSPQDPSGQLVPGSQALTGVGKEFPDINNTFRFFCVQWRGEQKSQGTPAARTVIAPLHHFEVETCCNLRCYTLEKASMVLGGGWARAGCTERSMGTEGQG